MGMAQHPLSYSTIAETRSRERLIFTIVIGAILHAVVILGVTLSPTKPPERSKPIAIQLNPIATQSGKLDPRKTSKEPNSTKAIAKLETQQEIIEPEQATPLTSVEIPRRETTTTPLQQTKPRLIADRGTLIQAIKDFDTKTLAEQEKAAAFGTRVLTLQEGRPETNEVDAYLAMWKRKCERIGNNNYANGNLAGELLMEVVIGSDGRLLKMKLLHSSGHPSLDKTALDTVRRAAPFQPFSVTMRKQYDRIEFTRRWRFQRQSSSID